MRLINMPDLSLLRSTGLALSCTLVVYDTVYNDGGDGDCVMMMCDDDDV